MRGFHATRRLKILPPRLKAAAGPDPDPEEHDEEPDAEQILAVTEVKRPHSFGLFIFHFSFQSTRILFRYY